MVPLISSYYATEDRSKRLGKKQIPIHYEFGSLSLAGVGDTLMINMDPKKLINHSGSTKPWERIKNDPVFPSSLFTEEGILLETFFSLETTKVWDIINLNIMLQLDNAMGGSESLLRNVTFGMNMGDDEIGFRFRIFRQSDGKQ